MSELEKSKYSKKANGNSNAYPVWHAWHEANMMGFGLLPPVGAAVNDPGAQSEHAEAPL